MLYTSQGKHRYHNQLPLRKVIDEVHREGGIKDEGELARAIMEGVCKPLWAPSLKF
jgi:hypothetical protein